MPYGGTDLKEENGKGENGRERGKKKKEREGKL
jgi:hypothetical protein